MKFALSVLYVSFIGVLSFFIGLILPRSWFKEDCFPYKTAEFENGGKIYEKLAIRKWKAKVPDMSKVMKDMLPKTVSYGANSNDLQMLIKETCVAEFIHFALCILSLGVYYFWKNEIGIILSGIAVFCNIPFILIQRYNRPHLNALRDRKRLREEKHKNENTHSFG